MKDTYLFKEELNLDFRDRKKAGTEIGILPNTLGLILRGQLRCSKQTAYYITKLLFKEAEIEDFFVRVEKETEENENEEN